MTREPARILDLCCGSGCLGILASEVWPEADVVLADISEPALAVAERNIDRFEARSRIRTVQSDLLITCQRMGPLIW